MNAFASLVRTWSRTNTTSWLFTRNTIQFNREDLLPEFSNPSPSLLSVIYFFNSSDDLYIRGADSGATGATKVAPTFGKVVPRENPQNTIKIEYPPPSNIPFCQHSIYILSYATDVHVRVFQSHYFVSVDFGITYLHQMQFLKDHSLVSIF
jgi:hypothetical protein